MGTTSVTSSPKQTWAAIISILAIGMIHLALAPEYLDEAVYVGVLFVAIGAASGLVATGIARSRAWTWFLGALMAGTAFVLFIASNTTGLPGLAKDLDVSGFVALAVEVLFVSLATSAPVRCGPASGPDPIPGASQRISGSEARKTM